MPSTWGMGSSRLSPVRTSQTLTASSQLAVTTLVPSGVNTAPVTRLLCQRGGVTGFHAGGSHTLALLSSHAVLTRLPSGLNAAKLTTLPSRSGLPGGPKGGTHPTPEGPGARPRG